MDITVTHMALLVICPFFAWPGLPHPNNAIMLECGLDTISHQYRHDNGIEDQEIILSSMYVFPTLNFLMCLGVQIKHILLLTQILTLGCF